MAVTSLVERLNALTRNILERGTRAEDDVVYAVAMDDYVNECEHGDVTCEPGVSFFLSIPVDGPDPSVVLRAKAAWTMTVRAAMDYEFWEGAVQETLDNLTFERVAVESGLIEDPLGLAKQTQDGEVPGSPE